VVECDPSTSCREAVFASVVAGTGADLSAAAVRHGTQMVCLAEIDCGARRRGANTTTAVVALAQAIDGAAGPRFAAIQACQWAMQHIDKYDDRRAKIGVAVAMVKDAVAALAGLGIACDIVGGGGTGSYYFEAASGGL